MALSGLADRAVLVTGGASGIGYAVVERLLYEGARVAVVDLDADRLERLRDEWDDSLLLRLIAEVSSVDDIAHSFTATVRRFGRLDGVVANAGVLETGTTLAETDPEAFDRVIAVNLRGVFLALRAAIRTFDAQGVRGSVVATSSINSVRGFAGSAAYSASKAGILGLVRAAAIETGPAGHRVNAVVPGTIATEVADRIIGARPADEQAAFRESLVEPIPLGRLGDPADVAGLIAWLLCDESTYVTGGEYAMDGGQAAG